MVYIHKNKKRTIHNLWLTAISKSYWIKIKDGLVYSLSGFKFALREKPFRIELAASSICLPIIILINRSASEKAVLVFSLFLILITEVFNSAIEKALDKVSTKRHPLIKQAKDMASCAVFLSVINFIVMCVIILM